MVAMATSPASLPSLFDLDLPIAAERDSLARRLEEAEERFRLLTQRTPLGVFRLSPDGRFVEVNPALVRILGYASELELYALTGTADIFIDPLERERLRLQLAHGPVDCAAARWRRKDGSPITVRLTAQAVHDDAGRLVAYDGIAEDVSERLRQQELLRRTERMACLGASLAGVAHELNNPLAAILGFAQLLLKREPDADARVALETIDHEATRAGKIVRDLLTLARKREAERRVRVNLNDTVRYIVRTRSYALETHGITCRASFDADLPAVYADPVQLEQVILNLLNNAEQAIRSARDDGGHIHVTTSVEDGCAVLEMEDDGPGVSESTRGHIWEPFWTTRGPGGGTGLGLAIVRDIVVGHGGEIEIDAPGELGGARFRVRLPAMSGEPSGARLAGRASHRALDVLVVEPDPKSLNFLTAFLGSRGHAALVAADVEFAVRLAEHLSFDAVICDAGIAGSATALGAFRATAGCAGSRFIVVAGNAASTARLPLPLPPAARVLMRPYDVEELRVLLED
jgi:PAS domain S-box-containing protein